SECALPIATATAVVSLSKNAPKSWESEDSKSDQYGSKSPSISGKILLRPREIKSGLTLVAADTAPLIAMPEIPDCSATVLSTNWDKSLRTKERVSGSSSWERFDMLTIVAGY